MSPHDKVLSLEADHRFPLSIASAKVIQFFPVTSGFV